MIIYIAVASKILAGDLPVPIGNPGYFGYGGQPSPFLDFGVLFTTLVNAFIIFTAIASFVYLIIGGFQYITSGGDKAGTQTAKDRIQYAIIGLVVVVATAAISKLLGAVLGINVFDKIIWPGP